MAYSIYARDGTSRIVLKRQSREAAEKKACELTELGWFEVEIAEETGMDDAPCAAGAANRFDRPIPPIESDRLGNP